MFSQERRIFQGKLTVAFQYLEGLDKTIYKGHVSDRTKGNGLKTESRPKSDVRKKLFTMRVVRL